MCAPLLHCVCVQHTRLLTRSFDLLPLCGAGGGAVEAGLSIYLENFATSLGSREQLAIAEFADALLVIPKTLAVNAAKVRLRCACSRRRREPLLVMLGVDLWQLVALLVLDILAGAWRLTGVSNMQQQSALSMFNIWF